MSAIYKVWMQVERIDHENDEYETFTDMEEDVAVFLTEHEAFEFIHIVAEEAAARGHAGDGPVLSPPQAVQHF